MSNGQRLQRYVQSLVSLAVIVGIVLFAFYLQRGANLPESPEDAVNQYFEAAAAGNIEQYLALLDPQLQQQVKQTIREMGRDAFRQSLQQSMQDVKGLAVSRQEVPTPDSVVIRAELVFADRNEVQMITCRLARSGWQIVAIDQAQMRKPPIPYGTPVFDIQERTEEVQQQLPERQPRQHPPSGTTSNASPSP